MSGDEDEVWEEPADPTTVLTAKSVACEEVVEPVATSPVPTTGKERQTPAYWQAVISALSPEKQAAAWQFFQERELGLAKGATDTLSGLVLLLEANGLFMDACAKRLADADILPVLESIQVGVNGLESKVAGHPAAGTPPHLPAAVPASIPSGYSPALGKASTGFARSPAVWCLAVLLALAAGGLGAWLGGRHARVAAQLQVEAQVRQIRTWLDVDEQARAILMSRKGELAFGFARDPSLGNRKVYTLTIKGVSILRAGKTKEGAGVIAFDSGGPDLAP